MNILNILKRMCILSILVVAPFIFIFWIFTGKGGTKLFDKYMDWCLDD